MIAALALSGCGKDAATVPEVIGLHPDQAVQRICEAGLRPGRMTELRNGPPLAGPPQFDTAMRASRITTTRPAAGSKVDPGSPVDITFSVPRNADLGILIANVCDSPPPS